MIFIAFFFFNDTATTEIYTLSLHDALPIFIEGRSGEPAKDNARSQTWRLIAHSDRRSKDAVLGVGPNAARNKVARSEEHTSELQSRQYLVCRLLLEKKKIIQHQ